MDQTPAHDRYNPDLLALIPQGCQRIVEVGCSTGALAKAYRSANPTCCYVGLEIDEAYARRAREHCSAVLSADVECLDDDVFAGLFPADCWVFGDTLEHLRDPWRLLARIRAKLTPEGCVVACIPNAQHWSVQARLSCGLFRYEKSGLLDKTHLRWFTRITINELFEDAGFRVVKRVPRVFNEPAREKVLPAIRAMASALGVDPEVAVADALPLQFVVRAQPG